MLHINYGRNSPEESPIIILDDEDVHDARGRSAAAEAWRNYYYDAATSTVEHQAEAVRQWRQLIQEERELNDENSAAEPSTSTG